MSNQTIAKINVYLQSANENLDLGWEEIDQDDYSANLVQMRLDVVNDLINRADCLLNTLNS